MKILLTACLVPLLFQCAPQSAIDPATYRSAPLQRDLTGVKIPVMQSSLDKTWGISQIVVLKNGGYSLTYTKPGEQNESLTIYGAPGEITSVAPANSNSLKILGRDIACYPLEMDPNGAMIPRISTVTFAGENSGQPVASYRLIATSFHQNLQKYAYSYLKTVSF